MLKDLFFRIPLQYFGDGGDGGAAGGDGGASATGDSGSGNNAATEARIPERARKYHDEAVKLEMQRRGQNPDAAKSKQTEANKAESTSNTEEKSEKTDKKLSYKELIKSPEYAEEHKKYMEDTLSKRLSKYSDTEAKYAKVMDTLGYIATKYGLDPNSESFVSDIDARIKEDDDFFSEYAAQHNMPVEEARANAVMQTKLAKYQREEADRKAAEQNERAVATLRNNATATKSLYPEFDLDAEMQNDAFRRMCAATGGDTTTAYRIAHWDEIQNKGRMEAAEEAKRAVTESIRNGQARPQENGLNAQTPIQNPVPDFSGMDKKQLHEYYFTHLKGRR